jgi:hypothetical protein
MNERSDLSVEVMVFVFVMISSNAAPLGSCFKTHFYFAPRRVEGKQSYSSPANISHPPPTDNLKSRLAVT